MWVEKHRPQTPEEVVGNEEAKLKFLSWLKKWKPGGKAALLHGPPGVGKTALVHAAAKAAAYDLIEMNASDARTAEKIMRTAGHAASESSIFQFFSDSKGVLILLDEVDGIYGREDQGGLGAILKLLEESKVPVALTANDISDMRLRELKNACLTIRFQKVRPPVMVAWLEEICRREGLEAEEEALKLIAARSRGDVRSAVNDLQALAEKTRSLRAVDVEKLTARDRQLSVQEVLGEIFLTNNPLYAKRAQAEAEVDRDLLHLSVHENLPYQFTDPEDLAAGYDALSRADVFFGRVKRTQNWGLLSYALEQMSMGVAAARRGKYTPAGYRFPPSRILILGRTKAQRELIKEISAKIGVKCHVSRRRAAADFLPYLRVMFQHSKEAAAAQLASWLGLDEAAVAYLKGEAAKPSSAPARGRKPAGRRGARR